MEKLTLALAKDQPYGDKGRSVRPGTVIAEIEFAENIPPNLANAQYIRSGLQSGHLVDARTIVPADNKKSLEEPTGPMRNILDE